MGAKKPEEMHQLFEQGFNAGDVEALLALYEEQALLVPAQGAEPVQGKAAIGEALGRFLALKGQITLQTRTLIEAGEVALLRSAWHLKGTGPDGTPIEMAHGSSEVVRRQADGSWKYLIDHPFGAD